MYLSTSSDKTTVIFSAMQGDFFFVFFSFLATPFIFRWCEGCGPAHLTTTCHWLRCNVVWLSENARHALAAQCRFSWRSVKTFTVGGPAGSLALQYWLHFLLISDGRGRLLRVFKRRRRSDGTQTQFVWPIWFLWMTVHIVFYKWPDWACGFQLYILLPLSQ